MVIHEIELDVRKSRSRVPPSVLVRVGDVGTQVIRCHLLNDGAEYEPEGLTPRLDLLTAGGTWVRCSATIDGPYIECELPSQALSTPGECKLAHFVLFDGTTESESTIDFGLYVLREVKTDGETAENYDGLMTDLYAKWTAYNQQAQQAETARVNAENTRKSQETARQNAESQRKSQETARQNAETARASEFATLKSQSQSATNAANGAATNAKNAATYARSVADNLQSSVVGDEEVAEMRGQIDVMGSMIADLRGDFYYLDGCVYAPSDKASISGSTVTLGSTCSASGTTITLA